MTRDVLTPELDRFLAGLDRFGRAWNGYEVRGLEHVPAGGGAMLVAYHALMPLDAWYLGARTWLERRRLIRAMGDRWLFRTPVMRDLVAGLGAVPGNREDAVRLLREGQVVGVSPGGVREALAGRKRHYQLVWGARLGFARVALEAGVDVLPVFTENCEDLARAPLSGSPPFQALYEATRLPLVPVVMPGPLPFPVKLVTHIGPPVRHDPTDTPEGLRDRVAEALQHLMDTHQDKRRPRLLRSLAARLT